MNITIQITQIVNGWVVGVPPSEADARAAAVRNQMPQPKASYCKDFHEVVQVLKDNWPEKIAPEAKLEEDVIHLNRTTK